MGRRSVRIRLWRSLAACTACVAVAGLGVPVVSAAPSTAVWLPTGWVDTEATPTGGGYWVLAANGSVLGFGVRHDFGGAGTLANGESAVSISTTPDGTGYWIFTDRGRVVPRGSARSYGDASTLPLNRPIVDSIATPTGGGYYLVASDGGVFTYGDARFVGSTGGMELNAPVESLVPDPDGAGYWLVASDGGVFSFDADFRGSMGGTRLNNPVTGIVPFGDGYVLVAGDGGAFVFSDKPFTGSLGGNPPASPVVSITARPQGDGYWMLTQAGGVYAFGSAVDLGSPLVPEPRCARSLFAMDIGPDPDELVRIDVMSGQITKVGPIPIEGAATTALVGVGGNCTNVIVSYQGTNGSRLRRLYLEADRLTDLGDVPGPTALHDFSPASLTHDGMALQYQAADGLHAVNLDDGGDTLVATSTAQQTAYLVDLITATGVRRRLVSRAGTQQLDERLEVVDLSTGRVLAATTNSPDLRLTLGGRTAVAPSWSPDQTRSVFSQCANQRCDLRAGALLVVYGTPGALRLNGVYVYAVAQFTTQGTVAIIRYRNDGDPVIIDRFTPGGDALSPLVLGTTIEAFWITAGR